MEGSWFTDDSWITHDQLNTFHSIDREVFSRMVINLMRDPAECLIIVATWLWLEQMGYPNIIANLTSLSDPILDIIVEEMAVALASLQSTTTTTAFGLLPNRGFMPGTSALMSQHISVDLFRQNRFTTITGVKSLLSTVCGRIFADILHSICPLSRSGQLVVPGLPHPLFGGVTMVTPPRNGHLGRNGIADHFAPPGGLWGWDPNSSSATEDDKTLFLTFSRGFPVTKEEVTELFSRKYGDGSVVSVLMQENVTDSDQQPLFAKILLRSVMIVDEVLGGDKIAKFRINGKHIWARKYERREQMAAAMPPTAPPQI